MLNLKPFDAPIGAEISGLNLATDLTDSIFGELEAAFHKHAVLVFRQQKMSPAQQMAFSQRWGPLDVNVRSQYNSKSNPEVLIISNILENGKPIGVQDAGRYWHTDLCYRDTPARATFLHAIEVPTKDGAPVGDTLFSSMTKAYEGLSADLKRRLDSMTAVHSYEHTYDQKVKDFGIRPALSKEQKSWIPPDVVQPVIRRHPFTGEKCLYVNEGYTTRILEMSQEESDEILPMLIEHARRPEFIYRNKWQPGDLTMWDNCLTQHKAVMDYQLPQRRLLERTTVLAPKSGHVYQKAASDAAAMSA